MKSEKRACLENADVEFVTSVTKTTLSVKFTEIRLKFSQNNWNEYVLEPIIARKPTIHWVEYPSFSISGQKCCTLFSQVKLIFSWNLTGVKDLTNSTSVRTRV